MRSALQEAKKEAIATVPNVPKPTMADMENELAHLRTLLHDREEQLALYISRSSNQHDRARTSPSLERRPESWRWRELYESIQPLRREKQLQNLSTRNIGCQYAITDSSLTIRSRNSMRSQRHNGHGPANLYPNVTPGGGARQL